jgi:hypothetical protein
MKTISLLLLAPIFIYAASKEKRKENHPMQLKANAANATVRNIVPAISVANAGVVEGNVGQRSVEVMVILSPVPTSEVTVAYTTRNNSASAGSDYVAANGTITLAPGEMMKRITVSIIGDQACEPDETFEIVLTNPSGGTLNDSVGKVTIVNDDCKGVSPAGGLTSGRNVAVYEVRLTYTGYTTFYGGPPDCAVRTNGKVILTGLLSGAEDVDPADDISYTGVLQLDIDMDICSAKRLPNGEDRLCSIRTLGCGEVKTELEIYSNGQDSARGGYVKIQEDTNEFVRLATGDCDNTQVMEEQGMIPNKTIAAIFNGAELPMLTSRTLRVGRYVERGDAGEIVVEVLRVVKK